MSKATSGSAGIAAGTKDQLVAAIARVRSFLASLDQTIIASNNVDYAVATVEKQYTAIGSPSMQSTLRDGLAATRDIQPTDADGQKLVAIVQTYAGRFESVGLKVNGSVDTVTLGEAIHQRQESACGNLFNNTSATSFSIGLADVTPLLDDPKASPRTSTVANIATVACTSPFSLSAGAEFSFIRNQEFGIIQVPGGANNTSLKVYGLKTDSPIHTLPLAVANVRILESKNKVVALHGSFGVSGNIQAYLQVDRLWNSCRASVHLYSELCSLRWDPT